MPAFPDKEEQRGSLSSMGRQMHILYSSAQRPWPLPTQSNSTQNHKTKYLRTLAGIMSLSGALSSTDCQEFVEPGMTKPKWKFHTAIVFSILRGGGARVNCNLSGQAQAEQRHIARLCCQRKSYGCLPLLPGLLSEQKLSWHIWMPARHTLRSCHSRRRLVPYLREGCP